MRLPLAERLIPIIADEYPDPEKGSGAVKITAAHDFNDFDVWSRHRDKDYFKKQINGGLINLFTPEAKMNENTPPQYRGLDRYEARKRIIADLEALGLLDQIETITNAVPHGDRSNVVIEPYLTEQWYVNAHELAKPAIAAVREGKTKFVPQNWENTYFNWMENIQPWCISRQLWWGHQIPAWYGPDGKVFVAAEEADAQAQADKHYGKATAIKRDEDVLDTWFSSALWPFSTLGWPDKTPELDRFYPTSVLVTGFDIIFFWVARMMMMGLHFMKDGKGAPEIPFHDIYIHRLVRDASGAKMSKSKGNVVDPLGVIDEFGADALRFTLMRNVAPGHDIRLGPQDVENNRNFATKLWNAARFVEFNGAARVEGFDPKSGERSAQPLDRARDAKGRRRNHQGDRDLRLRRRRERRLSLCLERLLRLVCRIVEAAAHRPRWRGQNRDARDGRLGARRNHQAAASLHALHHRRAVEGDGGAGAQTRCDARAQRMAEARRPDRRQGRSRNRLGDRSHLRHSFDPRRDEHHRQHSRRAGWRVGGNASARRALGRLHQAPGARVGNFLRAVGAAGLGATGRARRGGGACR